MARRQAQLGEWPDIDGELLAYLEGAYPPRCIQPGERFEDHVRYAGKVELIAAMRSQYDARREAF